MEALALIFAAAVVGLAISAAHGRFEVRACCPEPQQDLRMQGAGDEAR